MTNDAQLLAAWRGGDLDAGNVLIRRHARRVYRFFSTRAAAVASDLTQQTLLACVEGHDSLRADGSFRAFLFGIARRQLLMHLRGRYRADRRIAPRHPSIDRISPGSKTTPTRQIARDQRRDELAAAIRRLPVDFQIAIALTYWEQLSPAEVAEVLGVPTGTVKSRLARARHRLRAEIEA